MGRVRVTHRLLESAAANGGGDLTRLIQSQREEIRALKSELELAERQVRDAALVMERQRRDIARLQSLTATQEGPR